MDVQGWNGNHKIFGELISNIKPTTIIEVGTWHGQSAITMARECRRLGLDTKIYCVDTWLGALEFMNREDAFGKPVDLSRDLMKVKGYPGVYYQFLHNIEIAGVKDMIIPIPQTSQIAALWFKREGITADMVYIDAGHDRKSVTDDIIAYYPLCADTLFGDDYTNKDYEVKEAVDAIMTVDVIDNNFWVHSKYKKYDK